MSVEGILKNKYVLRWFYYIREIPPGDEELDFVWAPIGFYQAWVYDNR